MQFEPFYTDEFQSSAAKLDGSVREIVRKRINKILENPFLGKPLHGKLLFHSERFLHYRIIYRVEESTVIFVRVGKRDEVYREY